MRLTTTYSLHRTDTGRLSSGVDNSDVTKGLRKKNMQLQNVPKSVRDVVRAEVGKILIGGDLQAIEWCVSTWYAMRLNIPQGFHKALLEKFLAGKLDPHSYLASVAYSSNVPTANQRQSVKPFTYGYLFDGAPSTLAREAGKPDAVGKLVCAAHDQAFKFRPIKNSIVEQAKKEHCVTTPLGWCRWFWAYNPKPTEILGTKIQGTAADLLKWLLLSSVRALPPTWEILSTTHDSFLMQVPLEDEVVAKAWLTRQMQQSIPWMDGLRWRAKVKSGMTWKAVS